SSAALRPRADRAARAAPVPREWHPDHGRRDDGADGRRGHRGGPARRRAAARDAAAVSEGARRRWLILAVIVLAQTMANVGPLGIRAIASLIRDDFGLTLTQAGSFLSVYHLGAVTMAVIARMLAAGGGRAKTLVLGQSLIAGGLLAAGAAGSYGVMLMLLGIAGVGYGTLSPASTTAAMSWFSPRRRATVVGLKQVGLPFGGILGAALMPALALRLGWRGAIG